jgi:hypothetical protein
MTQSYREIERKYVAQGDFVRLERDISALFPYSRPEKAESTDRFWRGPNVDFVRLRENSKELTVKVTDQATIVDRVEVNVRVDDLDAAARLCTLLFGEATSLVKRFTVWTLHKGIVVCLYQVGGDDRVFLEVEAPTLALVDEYSKIMTTFFTLTPETRSLYQIFFPKEAA